MEFLQSLLDAVKGYAPKLLSALIVLIIGYIVYRIFYKLLKKAFRHSKIDVTLSNFILPVLRITLLVLLGIIVLSTAGVPTTSLLAVFSVVGLAVSFAVKDSLSNLAGGILLLFSKPFVVGDVVEVEGVTGIVKNISILYTNINTFDNRLIMVPNGQISQERIINISAEPIRRIDLVFDIAYSDDIETAKALIHKVVEKHELIHKDPEPIIRADALANSSVQIVCRAWVETPNYAPVRFDLIEQVKASFDKSGITIPFNQLDVNVIQ